MKWKRTIGIIMLLVTAVGVVWTVGEFVTKFGPGLLKAILYGVFAAVWVVVALWLVIIGDNDD